MNKYIIYIVCPCVISEHSFSNDLIKLLEQMAFDAVFNSKGWVERKGKVDQDLKEGKYNAPFFFRSRTLKDIDCSGMYFRGIDFTKLIFDNVTLKNADLTDAIFGQARFTNLKDLKGAILYCPLDGQNLPIMHKALKLKNTKDHFKLVKKYSKLQKKINDPEVSQEDKDLYQKHSEALNSIFPALYLKLKEKNLQRLDLRNLNLSNSNLCGCDLQGANLKGVQLQNTNLRNVKLQGAYLPNGFQMPLYDENDRTQLLRLWAEGTPQEQEALQLLFNANFDLITRVAPELLRRTLEEKIKLRVDLNNANLTSINTQGINFQNAQLQNADLYNANLEEAYLKGADLSEARLNENYYLTKNCRDKDLLDCYQSCDIPNVKMMLKYILLAKEISFTE